jgi:phosphoserine phosphatase
MVRLIAFDLEGTLVKSVSGWVELHKRFGTWEKGKEYAEAFFNGEIDYATWAKLDASLWKGHTREEIMEWVNSVEYMDYAKELVEFLKENGFKIAILSSGLMCLARKVGEELGVDYVYANELIFDEEGRITGEVNPVVDFQGKGAILRKLKEELKPELTVAVGDGYNDISMFKEADVAIAINPHEGVEGDHNVESLYEVREIIEGLIRGQ